MPPARLALLPTAVAALALLPAAGRGQGDALGLQGLTPVGTRTTLTDGGGVLRFAVANRAAEPRDARVAVEYAARPGVRAARDLWVPAGAVRTTWLPVGARPGPPAGDHAEVRVFLYDRTGGRDARVLLPGDGELVRTRLVPARPRVPTTALVADPLPDVPDPGSPGERAVALVKAVRAAAALPAEVVTPPDGPLPPTPEAFDGTDHVVLAGDRLAADPAGRWALRQWVERGGRLWVMLDMVDADAVAPFFGDDRPVQVVDRVGLTRVVLSLAGDPAPTPRDYERPVELVRVVPADGDRVFAVANGWPAGFARTLGRGRVFVTTLGAAGWLPAAGAPAPGGPRGFGQGQGQTPGYLELHELAAELHPRGLPRPLSPDALRPLLVDEIGYTVMGRGTAAALLGGFLVAVVGLGVVLRRSRRPELVGWLAPAAAVGAAGVFVAHAELSRRAVPPTVAVAAVAEAVPGTGEVVVTGVFAAYQPESGPVPLAAPRGGTLDLDVEGLEGQPRVRVQTDTDAWHVEDLALPAGVRTGRFQTVARPGPVAAVARFGPDGVDGRLAAPGFGEPADALVVTPAGHPVGARFRPDGGFAAGPGDALPPGQYLSGAVLTDRQQRRQAVYRQLLGGPLPPHLEGRALVLAWADAGELPFTGRDGSRALGTVLLVAPLELERTGPGARVTVPAGFVAVRKADQTRVTAEGSGSTEMKLRFQLPAAVLPLAVERAALHLRVAAPGRRVAVRGLAGGRAVELFAADAPAGPVRVDVTDPALLRPDGQGGIHLTLSIASPGAAPVPWKIAELGLEVGGRTGGG